MNKRLVLAAALLLVLIGAALAFLRTPDGGLEIQPLATLKAADFNIGSLVIWDKYLAWMGIPDPSGKNARVLLHDLDTKKTKTVAQGIYGGGISWVRASKDTVVYIAFESLPCDDTGEKERQASGCAGKPRPWKAMALDVETGKRRALAEGKTEIQQTYPILPEIEWPWVIWANPPSEPGPRPTGRGITAYDLRDGKKQILMPGAIPGRATISDGNVFFSAAVPGPNKWDLFTAPADGSKPSRKLTNSGKVFLPRATNGMIAWQEPIKDAPDAGTDSAIWTLPIKGKDEPIRISGRGNNPFPGKRFVIWLAAPKQGGQLLFSNLSKSKQPQILEPYPSFGPGWWADGDRVVWATVSQGKDKVVSTIHVARLTGR